jgi:anti-anti-sigma factor
MAESLEVHIRHANGVGIVETAGYINNIGGEKVAEACNDLIEEGVHHFVLNLAKSHIINSVGISILIEVIEKVKALKGKVAFCCLTPTIAKTFRIMGLLEASSIYDTEQEAVQALGAPR